MKLHKSLVSLIAKTRHRQFKDKTYPQWKVKKAYNNYMKQCDEMGILKMKREIEKELIAKGHLLDITYENNFYIGGFLQEDGWYDEYHRDCLIAKGYVSFRISCVICNEVFGFDSNKIKMPIITRCVPSKERRKRNKKALSRKCYFLTAKTNPNKGVVFYKDADVTDISRDISTDWSVYFSHIYDLEDMQVREITHRNYDPHDIYGHTIADFKKQRCYYEGMEGMEQREIAPKNYCLSGYGTYDDEISFYPKHTQSRCGFLLVDDNEPVCTLGIKNLKLEYKTKIESERFRDLQGGYSTSERKRYIFSIKRPEQCLKKKLKERILLKLK